MQNIASKMNNDRSAEVILRRLGTLLSKQCLGRQTIQHLQAHTGTPPIIQWILDPQQFEYDKFNCYWVFLLEHTGFLEFVAQMKIAAIKDSFEVSLKKKYSAQLAAIYFNFFA